MKKLVSLFLILALFCTALPALAEDDISGDWYADYYGMVLKLSLAEDGSAGMQLNDSIAGQGTWQLDGDQFLLANDEGSETHGIYADGALTLVLDDMSITFGREPVEGIKLAEINNDVAADAFEGKWMVKYVSIFGLLMDASTASESMDGESFPDLMIKDGVLTFSSEDPDENAMSDLVGNDPVKMTFADGSLSYDMSISDDYSATICCIILQDGMLGMSICLDSEEIMSVYCEPVEDVEVAEEPAA